MSMMLTNKQVPYSKFYRLFIIIVCSLRFLGCGFLRRGLLFLFGISCFRGLFCLGLLRFLLFRCVSLFGFRLGGGGGRLRAAGAGASATALSTTSLEAAVRLRSWTADSCGMLSLAT